MKYLAMVLILILGFSGSLCAQQPEQEKSPGMEKIDEFFEKEINEIILPKTMNIEDLDEATKEQYFLALRSSFEYRISGFEHRQEVFQWQLYSSKIIFIVVVLLVLVGIYFSGVQFHSSLRWKRAKDSKGKDKTEEKEQTTEIVASAKGIKVSSPILGVIILVISLLFFYLYLVYVYPITEIF
jgi:Tfp pilus assembly protein PilO